MPFKDEAARLADDSHLPPVDAHRVLIGGKRRLRRRRIAAGSVSLVAVAALGVGGYAVGQGFLPNDRPVPATPSPAPSPTLQAAGDACEARFPWDGLLADNVPDVAGDGWARVVHIADDGSTVVESHTADEERVALIWFPTIALTADAGIPFYEFDRSEGGGLNGIDRSGDLYVFNTSQADGTAAVMSWSLGESGASEQFSAVDVFQPVAIHGDSVVYLERDALKMRTIGGGDEVLIADGVAQFGRDGDGLVLTTQDREVRVVDLDTLEQRPAPEPVAHVAVDGVAARGGVWAWSSELDGTFGAWSGRWDGPLSTPMSDDRAYAASRPLVAEELVMLTDHESVDTVGSVWDLRTNAVTRLPAGYVAEGQGDFVVMYRTEGYRRDLVGIHPAEPLDELTCG
jgi:hypothetical protein